MFFMYHIRYKIPYFTKPCSIKYNDIKKYLASFSPIRKDEDLSTKYNEMFARIKHLIKGKMIMQMIK